MITTFMYMYMYVCVCINTFTKYTINKFLYIAKLHIFQKVKAKYI